MGLEESLYYKNFYKKIRQESLKKLIEKTSINELTKSNNIKCKIKYKPLQKAVFYLQAIHYF